MKTLNKFIKDILCEDNVVSLTRLIALLGFISFLIGSFYLIWKGTTWGNYETFAAITGGGGAVTQVANKFINSKYNSPQGQSTPNPPDSVSNKNLHSKTEEYDPSKDKK